MCTTVALLQAAFISVGPSFVKLHMLSFLLVANNLMMLTLTIIFYVSSIRLLRSIRENIISIDSRHYTAMASIYLLIYFAFKFPVILSQIFSKFLFTVSDVVASGIIRVSLLKMRFFATFFAIFRNFFAIFCQEIFCYIFCFYTIFFATFFVAAKKNINNDF